MPALIKERMPGPWSPCRICAFHSTRPKPLNHELQQSEQQPEGPGEALHPLHAQLVPFHAFLEQAEAPGLAVSQQRRHLALHHAQVSQYLCFKRTHHVHTTSTHVWSHSVAAVTNMALEKRE